ncbi:MAG: hypothetical protein JSW02_00785 [candidate division WOR-3 bacterium]|nr:MAG: hypothetical protein JSW02_00785 [candidate division WOR-3 bacterium]
MNKIIRIPVIVSAVIGLVLCSGKELAAQDVDVYRIIGRVTRVDSEGRSVIVNRGSVVHVIPDSICRVRSARGTESASTQILTAATIVEVYPDSMRAALDKSSDAVTTGDLCELYAQIPVSVAGSPIGMVAMHDIVFVDFYEELPIYMLAELIRAPQPETLAAIMQRFLGELYDQAEMGDYSGETTRTGLYAGMTIPEAFAFTDTYKLERFFEYVIQDPGAFSGQDWIFVDVFRGWIRAGTPVHASDREP